jgi:hypothetical protein
MQNRLYYKIDIYSSLKFPNSVIHLVGSDKEVLSNKSIF